MHKLYKLDDRFYRVSTFFYMYFADTVYMYPSPTATLSPFAPFLVIVLSFSDVSKAILAVITTSCIYVPLGPLQLQMMLT